MKRSTGVMVTVLCALALGTSRPAMAEDNTARNAALFRESYQLEANRSPAGALAKMREIASRSEKTYYVAARMAWLAYLAGDFATAETSYREAATLAPKALEPRIGLTTLFLAQKKWRELERACRDVLALDANHATSRARLAYALYLVGNYPDSAVLYRRLMDEFPGELDHQTGLGWDLLKMGKRAEARGVFAAVLAVSPDNVSAKQGIAAP